MILFFRLILKILFLTFFILLIILFYLKTESINYKFQLISPNKVANSILHDEGILIIYDVNRDIDIFELENKILSSNFKKFVIQKKSKNFINFLLDQKEVKDVFNLQLEPDKLVNEFVINFVPKEGRMIRFLIPITNQGILISSPLNLFDTNAKENVQARLQAYILKSKDSKINEMIEFRENLFLQKFQLDFQLPFISFSLIK